MLRMVLVGLLIPLGVGVLAAMEFRTPPQTATAAVQPFAEATMSISRSHGVLLPADRPEIARAESQPPAQPPTESPAALPEATPSDTPPPPKMASRPRPEPKPGKVPAARAAQKSKPKVAQVKRTHVPERQKAASQGDFCRLSAFGGLRKALNLTGCDI